MDPIEILSIDNFYRKKGHALALQLAVLKKKQNALGWTRLGIILITAVLTYDVFMWWGEWGWITALSGIALFLYIVSKDAANNEAITHTTNLLFINEEELKVLAHQYLHRFDGQSYEPIVHAYAADVDIFGKASLYQYINRCETEQGRELLASNLNRALPLEEIASRHSAVQELSTLTDWRQNFQAIALQTGIQKNIQEKIQSWLDDKETPYEGSFWKWFVNVYSLITIGLAVATLLDWVPGPVFSFLFLLFFIVSTTFSKKVMKPYMRLSGMVKEVDTISGLVGVIEQQSFESERLRKLQQHVLRDGKKASTHVRLLKEILNRFDLRLNVFVFMILNSFLLWDIRQMRALNEWKAMNNTLLPNCFNVIAEMEVLNSLATLHFNNTEWVFPQFKDFFTLEGQAIGHPLIYASKRVTSDFSLYGKGKIALVTGSNMAGKSTFLRSLAVNIILAQAGAPVCAKAFLLSPMQLMSSMRIADNLAESTSTFYAELKKLESIITSVKQHQPLFILLDEILRGTNSLDRHIGSKALIRQLIRENAVAVIATHDVELTALQDEFTVAIENYHFDVQVENGELYFDYKLKHGVCHSLNASILMKKIGIEL